MENNQQRQGKEVNKSALKTAIIISWIVLAVCFIIKIFGGKWFEIETSNGTFSKVCAFIDNHLWLQDIIAFLTSLFAASLLNLSVLKQRKFNTKQFVIVFTCAFIYFIVAILGERLNNEIISIISFILSLVPICICPIILSKKPIRSIMAFVLYAVFQTVSVIVKGLAITKINGDSSLIALIFSIDVYIMLVLYYLYANSIKDNKNKINKKGDSENG